MTVIFNRTSQTYPAGTVPFPITVADNLTEFTLTLTCDTWPTAQVGGIAVLWSNGMGAEFTLAGGQKKRDGSAITSFDLRVSKPAGVTSGTVTISLNQPITSAVKLVGV